MSRRIPPHARSLELQRMRATWDRVLCGMCPTWFPPTEMQRGQLRIGHTVYCSRACARHRPPCRRVRCGWCPTWFAPTPSQRGQRRRGHTVYCAPACAQAANRQQSRVRGQVLREATRKGTRP